MRKAHGVTVHCRRRDRLWVTYCGINMEQKKSFFKALPAEHFTNTLAVAEADKCKSCKSALLGVRNVHAFQALGLFRQALNEALSVALCFLAPCALALILLSLMVIR